MEMTESHSRFCLLRKVALVLLFLSTLQCEKLPAQEPPESVSVLPVFVVPKGQKAPPKQDHVLLAKHLQWAQTRYRELLGNQTTFKLEEKVKTFQSKWTIAQLEKGGATELLVEEMFDKLGTNRYSCKYIFVAVFAVPQKKVPSNASAIPFNGGVNTGGGIVSFPYKAFKSENFQSTLQHELGHAFGMLHVNAYGHDMKRNESIMSYNRDHHTNYLRPSRTPGTLIPENYRVLALNDRVFANFDFDAKRHLPKGYKLKKMRHLGPLDLPNDRMIEVETSSGETYESSVSNIVHMRIRPSIDRGEIEFDAKSMWHSAKQKDGIASVTLKFPQSIELDRIKVYSQHSGKTHEVTHVTVSTIGQGSEEVEIGSSEVDFPDGELTFSKTRTQTLKLDFKAGKSKAVVIRGLRFFSGDQEYYPPLVPYHAER